MMATGASPGFRTSRMHIDSASFGYATPSLAPQATATKRASNYGTYGADGTTA